MNCLLYYIFSIFLLYICHSDQLQIRILHTPIIGFLPQLRQHHVVLLTTSANKHNNYVIDFSPIHSGKPETLLRLLFAYNVAAETRIRYITDTQDDEMIIEKWNTMNNVDHIQSQMTSNEIFYNMKDKKLKPVFEKIMKWNRTTYMNLYFRNCQHFSQYIIQ